MTDDKKHDLSSFDEPLSFFRDKNLQTTVIGGCAVGAYAERVGSPVLSADLDVLASPADQRQIQQMAPMLPGVSIKKKPQPRSLKTLVLDWRGLEVDVLIESTGPLPKPEDAFNNAFQLRGASVLEPYALLENKLGLGRQKDEPHILILHEFIQGYILGKLGNDPSDTSAIKRYLKLCPDNNLPKALFDLILEVHDPLPENLSRLLAHRAPDLSHAHQILAKAPSTAKESIEAILSSRTPHE